MIATIQEPSCPHTGTKWDPDDSGFSRCYDCLEAEGWEYDAEYDEGWRDKWTIAGTVKLARRVVAMIDHPYQPSERPDAKPTAPEPKPEHGGHVGPAITDGIDSDASEKECGMPVDQRPDSIWG